MTTYSGTDEFVGATFIRASFKGATVRFSDVSDVTMRGVDVAGLDIDSHDLFLGSLFVNGVDVVPLVEAELNRQFPGRALQKAQTPEGLREGWVAVQAGWETMVADTPPELVDAHVEDEWSLAQTLRHLVLATDAWLRGAILRVGQPFHEIGQVFTGAEMMGFDVSIFRTEPPSFEEILEVRRERQRMMTDFLATVTPELLAEQRDDPWGADDWHPTVGDCVRVILEEEWAHLRYVRRDLALLGRVPEGDGLPHVLVIGLDPFRVPGPWDPEPVAEAIERGMAGLAESGYVAESCLLALDGSDDIDERLTTALDARRWDCVIVGGGLRKEEEQLHLFETIINLVRGHAPQAPIAFNSTPDDLAEAVARVRR